MRTSYKGNQCKILKRMPDLQMYALQIKKKFTVLLALPYCLSLKVSQNIHGVTAQNMFPHSKSLHVNSMGLYRSLLVSQKTKRKGKVLLRQILSISPHILKNTARQQQITDRAAAAANMCTTAPTVVFTAGLVSAGLHNCMQPSGHKAILTRLLGSCAALSTRAPFMSSTWQARTICQKGRLLLK